MDHQHIPREIIDNPNFVWDNEDRIKELNDIFCKIHTLDIGVKRSKDYKNLIEEVNGRYDAEMLVHANRLRRKETEDKLKIAQEELQYLKDKINNHK